MDHNDDPEGVIAELQRLLGSLGDYLWTGVVDDNGSLITTYASPAIETITGRPPALFLGSSEEWISILHPADRDRFAGVAAQLVSGQLERSEIEYRIVHTSGNTRWVKDETVVERLADGRLRLNGLVSDVTERRNLEDELRRLSRAVEQSPAVVMITEADGTIVYVNPAFTRITGYSAAEALGRNPRMLQSGLTPDAVYKDLWRTIAAGSTWRGELCNRKKNGELYWESISISPVTGGDGEATRYIAVKDDITDQKRAQKIEEALYGERLRTAKLESTAVLAGGIAHDFNNYLTGIVGNISLAQLLLTRGSTDRVSELLDATRRACEQTAKLTQQLLTFAKGGAPVKRRIDLATVLHDEILFFLSGSKTRCEFAIDHDLWAVEADAGQVSQVIHNIALNADQAMPHGGILEIAAENVVVGSRSSVPLDAGRYTRITFRDRGTGIPAEHLDRIFDPYYTTKPGGSGLGLATAYSILKRHGGHLAVESTVGEGTTFYAYLPTPKAAPMPAAKATVDTDRDALAGLAITGRILVMDDESTVLKFVVHALTAFGHDVTSARDGNEALALYEQALAAGTPYDVVILDLTVPGGFGGRSTLEAIRAADPTVKAIAASGYSEDPIIADPTAFGFTSALAKPLTVEDLAKAVGVALRSRPD